MFVGNHGSSTLTVFALDANGIPSLPTNPSLPLTAPAGTTTFSPSGMAMDPTGSVLFVPSESSGGASGNGTLLPIVITVSGNKLTLTPGTAVPTTSSNPVNVFVNPASGSNTLFTCDSSTVSCFTYTTAGVLGTPTSVANGGSYGAANWLTCDASSNVYVGLQADQMIDLFTVSGTTLTLAQQAYDYGSSYNGGPNCIVLDPTGKYMFMAEGDGSVGYTPTAGFGSATTPNYVQTPSAATTPNVSSVAINSAGTFLVAVCSDGSNMVVAYTVDSSGVPTQAGQPFSTTPGPLSATFHPSQNIVYIANGGKSPATISALSVLPTGLASLSGSPFSLPTGDTGSSSIVIK